MKSILIFFGSGLLCHSSLFDGGSGSGNVSAGYVGFINGDPSIFLGGSGDGYDQVEVVIMLGSTDLIDSDGDGMPDTYEVLNGLSPAIDDSLLDADGDGMTNFAEYLFCTDPQDKADVTTLSLVLGAGGANANLIWSGIANKAYAIYVSEDLESWTFEASIMSGVTGTEAISILLEGQGRLFFRLEIDQ